MGMLDYGRDDIDKAIRKLGQDFWEGARMKGPTLLLKKLSQLGSQYKIDGSYLLWMLIHHLKGWRAMPNNDMLRAVRALYIDNYSIGGDIPFELPDGMGGENRADQAFKELLAWSNKEFPDDLFTQVFKPLANKTAKEVQREMKKLHNETVTFKEAALIVVAQLPKRVRDHPHWFRDPTTIRTLVIGMLE